MYLQLNQIKSLSVKQGFSKIKILINSNSINVLFYFNTEFESNDVDFALLVTQKNELRNFKSIDSAYKLVSSLLKKDRDLFVDVVVSDNRD